MAFNDVENAENDKSRNFLLYFILPTEKLLAILENLKIGIWKCKSPKLKPITYRNSGTNRKSA